MAKSIKVKKIVQLANAFFEHSSDAATADRIGVAGFLNTILYETKTYSGYRYLKDYNDPTNDSTRVAYYMHPNLL